MADRDIRDKLLAGIREIKAHKAGKVKLRPIALKEPSPQQGIRDKLGLSQGAFSGLIGVSTRTLQDWEQGRRTPVIGNIADIPK